MLDAALIFSAVSEAGSWRLCLSQWLHSDGVIYKDVSPGQEERAWPEVDSNSQCSHIAPIQSAQQDKCTFSQILGWGKKSQLPVASEVMNPCTRRILLQLFPSAGPLGEDLGDVV